MHKIEILSSFELKSLLKKKKDCLAFVPIGSTEQHGPFLPMNTDSIIGEHFSGRLALRMEERGSSSFIFPTLKFSPTQSACNYSGNIHVRNENFRNLLKDVLISVIKDNFRLIILVNSHGTNEALINEAVFEAVSKQFEENNNSIRPILAVHTFNANGEIAVKLEQEAGRHADWIETAILYDILGKKYFSPELIGAIKSAEKERAEKGINILGAPIELRSKKGTLGALLPRKLSLAKAAEEVCRIIENYGFELIGKYLSESENVTKSRIEKIRRANL